MGGGRDMIKVMVLCTGNSCRSQMAEGFLKEMGRGRIEAHSAGVVAAGLHHVAVAVMREVGVDISGQRSKEIDPVQIAGMDLVITVCGNAEAFCPATPPSVRRLFMPINDPVGVQGTEEERMRAFRAARDEIREALAPLVEEMLKG